MTGIELIVYVKSMIKLIGIVYNKWNDMMLLAFHNPISEHNNQVFVVWSITSLKSISVLIVA